MFRSTTPKRGRSCVLARGWWNRPADSNRWRESKPALSAPSGPGEWFNQGHSATPSKGLANPRTGQGLGHWRPRLKWSGRVGGARRNTPVGDLQRQGRRRRDGGAPQSKGLWSHGVVAIAGGIVSTQWAVTLRTGRTSSTSAPAFWRSEQCRSRRALDALREAWSVAGSSKAESMSW